MTTSAGTTPAPQYASPVNYDTYRPVPARPRFRPQQVAAAPLPVPGPGHRGRIKRVPGRARALPPLHLLGRPWAQRTAIVRKLMRLDDVVSLSYVDDVRDARGWAFRERRGPDPVNGFTFLAQAYEATEPGYDGHVSVPVLWDRVTGKVVSNNFPTSRSTSAARSGGGRTGRWSCTRSRCGRRSTR